MRAAILLLSLTALPTGLRAQLRPPEPVDAALLDTGRVAAVRIGGAWLPDQRAGLAGVDGTLVEIGTYAASVRTGRVVLTLSGTAFRSFQDGERVRLAFGGAEPDPEGRREDAGEVRVSTAVRIFGGPGGLAGIRFGTLLPTTDNTVGLERDQTDFFALVFGSGRRWGIRGTAEAGLGVHGSRYDGFEQVDVLLYALALDRPGRVSASLIVAGQADGLRGWFIPGNENLGELRAGVRLGRHRWVRVEGVRGFEDASPSWGVSVSAGVGW